MAIKIQIFDGAIPMLDEIAKVSYGQALDALDHAGQVIKEAVRIEMATLQPWGQDFIRVNGVLKRQIRKGGSYILGMRKDQKTGNPASPLNMSNFVNSYLNIKQMYVIVGGMHPTNTPRIRRNGEVMGNVAKEVKGVSKTTYAILQKLNNGGTYESQSDMYKSGTVRPKMPDRFKGAKYQGHHFMEKGRTRAQGEVTDIMTTKLEQMIHKQINRTDTRYREVKTS